MTTIDSHLLTRNAGFSLYKYFISRFMANTFKLIEWLWLLTSPLDGNKSFLVSILKPVLVFGTFFFSPQNDNVHAPKPVGFSSSVLFSVVLLWPLHLKKCLCERCWWRPTSIFSFVQSSNSSVLSAAESNWRTLEVWFTAVRTLRGRADRARFQHRS